MIDYYLAVAPLMLPHVTGRPLCLSAALTAPGKNASTKSIWDRECLPASVEWRSPTGKARGETYVTVQGDESLAGLAQMNVLEIHPWQSTNADLEHPDRIIFDLDPDEAVSWPTLCESAQEVRDRLKQLGLRAS